jgi:hypothetical protein
MKKIANRLIYLFSAFFCKIWFPDNKDLDIWGLHHHQHAVRYHHTLTKPHTQKKTTIIYTIIGPLVKTSFWSVLSADKTFSQLMDLALVFLIPVFTKWSFTVTSKMKILFGNSLVGPHTDVGQ